MDYQLSAQCGAPLIILKENLPPGYLFIARFCNVFSKQCFDSRKSCVTSKDAEI